jgi:hypothetical protein
MAPALFIYRLVGKRATRYNTEIKPHGEVSEWLIELVSKTSVPTGTAGSNPALSVQLGILARGMCVFGPKTRRCQDAKMPS